MSRSGSSIGLGPSHGVRRSAAGVDYRGRSEKSQPIMHLNSLIVGDLAVRAPWNDLEEVPVRADRRVRQLAELRTRQHRLGHGELLTINLNMELLLGLAWHLAHRIPLRLPGIKIPS